MNELFGGIVLGGYILGDWQQLLQQGWGLTTIVFFPQTSNIHFPPFAVWCSVIVDGPDVDPQSALVEMIHDPAQVPFWPSNVNATEALGVESVAFSCPMPHVSPEFREVSIFPPCPFGRRPGVDAEKCSYADLGPQGVCLCFVVLRALSRFFCASTKRPLGQALVASAVAKGEATGGI